MAFFFALPDSDLEWVCSNFERRMPPGHTARYECPTQMMPMTFEDQASLACGSGGVKTRNWRVFRRDDFESPSDLQTAIGEVNKTCSNCHEEFR